MSGVLHSIDLSFYTLLLLDYALPISSLSLLGVEPFILMRWYWCLGVEPFILMRWYWCCSVLYIMAAIMLSVSDCRLGAVDICPCMVDISLYGGDCC